MRQLGLKGVFGRTAVIGHFKDRQQNNRLIDENNISI